MSGGFESVGERFGRSSQGGLVSRSASVATGTFILISGIAFGGSCLSLFRNGRKAWVLAGGTDPCGAVGQSIGRPLMRLERLVFLTLPRDTIRGLVLFDCYSGTEVWKGALSPRMAL